eukprot:scaffold118719_cov18-Tisochrysis_lutea.AAC.1
MSRQIRHAYRRLLVACVMEISKNVQGVLHCARFVPEVGKHVSLGTACLLCEGLIRCVSGVSAACQRGAEEVQSNPRENMRVDVLLNVRAWFCSSFFPLSSHLFAYWAHVHVSCAS